MKKTTLLTIAVIILILLNISVLAMVYFRPPGAESNGRREPREIIIERLHFNDNQVHEYEKLIKAHRQEINRLDARIRDDKHQLYHLLNNPDEGAKDSLINDIAENLKMVEKSHFKHFEDIKKLCAPQQLKYYDALIDELPRLFMPREGRPSQGRPPRQHP